jgi:hypothetical protein
MQVGQVAAPRERPLGVIVIALFMIIDAAVAAGQVIFDTSLTTRVDTLLEINEWMPALVVVLALARVAAAVGLFRAYRWAWVAAMLIVGVSLVFSLWLYWIGDPGYVRLTVNCIIAFYLNQGAVREYFDPPETTAEDLPVMRS